MSALDLLSSAEAAFGQKSYAEARAYAEQAIAAGLDPNAHDSERGEYWPRPEEAQCELIIGMSLLEQGECAAALSHLDRAVALDRENARVWANRGHLRKERGELELALADLTRALERDDGYAFARLRRAQCFIASQRGAEAERDLERILIPDPDDAAPFELWQSLRAARGAPATRADLPLPTDLFTWVQRAAFATVHRDFTSAFAAYDAALALDPNNEAVRQASAALRAWLAAQSSE